MKHLKRNNDIIAMAQDNTVSIAMIAKQFGITKQRVSQIMHAHGVRRDIAIDGTKYGRCSDCPRAATHHKIKIYNSVPLCLHCMRKRTIQRRKKKQWSLRYSQCIACSTTKTKHASHGLCYKCKNKK